MSDQENKSLVDAVVDQMLDQNPRQREPQKHERFRGDHPIVVQGLENRFGSQVVHQDLSLKVLMRSIIGLQRPSAGDIEIFGRSITAARPDEEIGVRNRWGVLFQGGALFSTLTVGENVEVPLKQFYPELSPQMREEIARYKVIMSGLPEEAACKFPTAGLDPIGAAAFDRLTRELKETLGLTVFLITHDLDTLYEICDRVAVLADKQVIAVGTIDELLETDHPWIEEYFNGPRGRAAQASQARENG